MNNFKLEGTEGRDDGCILSKTCQECPYISGAIEFTAQCVERYGKGAGKRGLVAEIRNSVIVSLFKKGISVTILARVFNISTRWTRKIISEKW